MALIPLTTNPIIILISLNIHPFDKCYIASFTHFERDLFSPELNWQQLQQQQQQKLPVIEQYKNCWYWVMPMVARLHIQTLHCMLFCTLFPSQETKAQNDTCIFYVIFFSKKPHEKWVHKIIVSNMCVPFVLIVIYFLSSYMFSLFLCHIYTSFRFSHASRRISRVLSYHFFVIITIAITKRFVWVFSIRAEIWIMSIRVFSKSCVSLSFYLRCYWFT